MITIYSYDDTNTRIEFTIAKSKGIISGVIKNAIEYDTNIHELQIHPDNMYYMSDNKRSRNKFILEYINEYFNMCNGEELPDIPAPCIYPNKQNPDLRTATLIDEKTHAIENKWADYIDKVVIDCPKTDIQSYSTEDLFCLLHTANYLDLKHLVSLCAVKISSYMALCQWNDNVLENVPRNFKRALDGLPILPD